MFGRKASEKVDRPSLYYSAQEIADEYKRLNPPEPTYSIEVETAEMAWAVIQWALSKVKTDYHYGHGFDGRYDKHVRVELGGHIGSSLRRLPDPAYRVVFPRYVWDDAKSRHTNQHAERKVRDEIFGKGK